MAADHTFIKVEVPPGFLPQSEPVKEDDRISLEDIRIKPVTKDDLPAVARGLHAGFPEVWWQQHEPLHMRAPEAVRVKRFAKRLEAFLLNPEVATLIKAVYVPTGELIGSAGWHKPVPAEKHVSCMTAPVLAYTGERPQPGWTEEDVQEMFGGVRTDNYAKEFKTYDAVRKEEFGDQQYWYLAPFFVDEKFRGRGVGGLLMKWAIEQADSAIPPVPMMLEALPNARPVYLYYGFEPPASIAIKPNRESLMIRPAKESRN